MQVDRRQIQNIDSVRDIKKKIHRSIEIYNIQATRKLDMYKMEGGQIQKIDGQINQQKDRNISLQKYG